MIVHKWYRAKDHKNMPNSFNCIYLLEIEEGRLYPKSYHLMIRDGKIIQIMNGQTFIGEDMDEVWFPLEDEKLVEEANKWAAFIEAKNLLREVRKNIIVSIKNNKLNKVWG